MEDILSVNTTKHYKDQYISTLKVFFIRWYQIDALLCIHCFVL